MTVQEMFNMTSRLVATGLGGIEMRVAIDAETDSKETEDVCDTLSNEDSVPVLEVFIGEGEAIIAITPAG